MPGSVIYDPQIACDNFELLAMVVAQSDGYAMFPLSFEATHLVKLPDPQNLAPRSLPIIIVEHESRPLSNAADQVTTKISALLNG